MAKKILLNQDIDKTEKKILENLIKFFQQYSKYSIFLLIIPFAIGFYFYKIKPAKEKREKNASSLMFNAIYDFEKKEFDHALNGRKYNKGFLDIIKEFPNTKAANLANLYSGIIYLNKEEYSTAIKYLQKFNTKDLLLYPRKISLIGDALSQQGEYLSAADKYLEASKINSNKGTSPKYLYKAAICFEKSNKNEQALSCYNEIQKKYPKSKNINEIKNHIYRLEIKINKAKN